MRWPLPWPPSRTLALWLPFLAGVAWLAVRGLAGGLALDLFHVLAVGLLGVAALLGLRLWTPALVMALLLSPLAWHFAVERPAVRAALAGSAGGALAAPSSARPGRGSGAIGSYLRLEGTVRGRTRLVPRAGTARKRVRLLLGEVRLWRARWRGELAELEVELPARSAWPFHFRRRVRIGGVLAAVETARSRLRLLLDDADFHFRPPPLSPWNGEGLRLRLGDRAAYYLSKPALAAYLPVLLGERDRTDPEAREVTGTFRRVGVAHLFAISGLHVGLLYLLFAAALGLLIRHAQRGQGWVHARAAWRVAVIALVWAYIALIGFPVPAVRAALMGTALVWSDLWGTRTPRLYILALAGLLLVALEPSLVYDLSFQLSFLAYFFLVSALGLWPRPATAGGAARAGLPRRMLAAAARGTALNLWLTLFITLGLWPLVAATFGQLSLLVFLGNLLMVPLLAWLVLPAGLLALGTSLACLGAAPEPLVERAAYGLLEPVLSGWVWVARLLERLGGALVFRVHLGWGPRTYFLYYTALLALLLLMRRARAGRMESRRTPA